MSTIDKLKFPALTIDGSNYLSWALDVEVHLVARDLMDAIESDQGLTIQEKARALEVIRHHMAESLKSQYLTEMNPQLLWDSLKLRFDHMIAITLPTARQDYTKPDQFPRYKV